MQARKASAAGCPYLSASARSRAAFQDTLLAAPMDIEALAAHGAKRAFQPSRTPPQPINLNSNPDPNRNTLFC